MKAHWSCRGDFYLKNIPAHIEVKQQRDYTDCATRASFYLSEGGKAKEEYLQVNTLFLEP